MNHLPPFWAMLRCDGFNASHNMELDTLAFRDPGFDITAGGYPTLPKGIEITVEATIVRNVCNISVDEVYCLSFLGA